MIEIAAAVVLVLFGFGCALLLFVWALGSLLQSFERKRKDPPTAEMYVPGDCDLDLVLEAFEVARQECIGGRDS